MAAGSFRSAAVRLVRCLSTSSGASASQMRPSVDPTVKVLVRSRRLREVEPYLEGLLPSPPSEPLLSSVILSYGFAHMLPLASRSFDLLPSTLSLNSLLTSYSRAGSPHLVPSLLSDLSKRHSIPPDAFTFSIHINALCAAGHIDKALSVLSDMSSLGLRPSTVTYTPIISKLYASDRSEDAKNLWQEMIQEGCIPDIAAYNVIAKDRSARRTPEELMELLDEIREAGLQPDAVTYNYLIACYCKNGRFLDAKSVYGSLKEKGVEPNAATYRDFVRLLCKNGDFAFAFDVCKDGIGKGKFPDASPGSMLVEGLAKVGREGDAAWLVDQFKRNWPVSLDNALRKLEELVGSIVGSEASATAA